MGGGGGLGSCLGWAGVRLDTPSLQLRLRFFGRAAAKREKGSQKTLRKPAAARAPVDTCAAAAPDDEAMTKYIFVFVLFLKKKGVYTYKKPGAKEERGEFDRTKKYKWVFERGELGKETESTKKKREKMK
jgi:hypothetical protein